jgi:hypothetical protein
MNGRKGQPTVRGQTHAALQESRAAPGTDSRSEKGLVTTSVKKKIKKLPRRPGLLALGR